jgi:hypothetical protein
MRMKPAGKGNCLAGTPLSQAAGKWQQQIARLDRRRKTNNV